MRHIYIISDPSGTAWDGEKHFSFAKALRSVRARIGGRVYRSEWFTVQRNRWDENGDEYVQMGEACICFDTPSQRKIDYVGAGEISISKMKIG